MRAHTLYNPPKVLDYMEEANKKVKVFAQIETVDGVNNLESILSVEGVSGALIGPNDLSADYGCLGDDNAKKVINAIEKLAKHNNKSIGIITGNKNYLKKAHDVGLGAYGGRRGGARGLGLAAAAWALSVPLSPAGARWSGLHSAGALSSLALTHRTDFFALGRRVQREGYWALLAARRRELAGGGGASECAPRTWSLGNVT